MKSIVSIIVAVARNGAIGRKGGLPFHISADLRHFKDVTMGKPVIMGRKTFESLPCGALPGRRNIVITRNHAYTAPNIKTVSSIDEALALTVNDPEVMVIGGGEIYRQALPIAEMLYITEIGTDVPDADTFFPHVDPQEWKEVESSECHSDTKSGVTYRFVTFKRSCQYRK